MEIHSSIDSSEELMHYGRKGMKWYQNIFSKDKVSSRGRKGRGDESGDGDDQKKTGDSGSSSSSSGKKSAKDMSEAELMSAIRHLQLEKQYRDLEAQQAAELDPPKTSKGKEFVSDFVKKAAVPAIQEAGKSVLKDWLVKVGKEAMGLNEKQVEDAGAKLKKEVENLELQKRKTLVEDFYKNRDEKAKRDAEKAAKKNNDKKDESDKPKSDDSSKSDKSSKQKGKETDDGLQDAVNYYFNGGPGQKKADSGKSFADDYVESVKAKSYSDDRTAKEKWDQSTGPVYTMDFTQPTVSLGQSFTNQFLLEDKSK